MAERTREFVGFGEKGNTMRPFGGIDWASRVRQLPRIDFQEVQSEREALELLAEVAGGTQRGPLEFGEVLGDSFGGSTSSGPIFFEGFLFVMTSPNNIKGTLFLP